MRYLAYSELDGIPNVVVDGAAHADSLITLSHWPKSGSPAALRDDLSAQIAFDYLDHPELHVPADVVSNNHFDQDGLMSVYALVDPAGARARREQVVDVARAGDFGTYRDRDSARISWTIAVLGALVSDTSDPYAAVLERVPELLDHPEHYRDLWADEDAHLEASEAAIRSGAASIEEIEDLDLAIISVPEDWDTRTVHRFSRSITQAIHPTAVHNATDRFRLLYVQGRRYEVKYRYETWVQYVTRHPVGRIDLSGLADELSALEVRGARWSFDGVGDIEPGLRLTGGDGSSAIEPERFRALLTRTLATGTNAWDPYD